jgi:hypothetical protein
MQCASFSSSVAESVFRAQYNRLEFAPACALVFLAAISSMAASKYSDARQLREPVLP